MTTVVLNTVTRKVEVFSSARDVQARAEIADHKAAADPHPQYLADADLAEVALSGDAGDLVAGTVPDARMPNWTGFNLPSRTALEAANVPAPVVGLRLLGHAAVGDGGGAHYKRIASEPAHPHKIQSADGTWWEELFAVDVTVNIPSDFATLQDAIDRLSKQPVRRGASIIVNIESGYALTAGIEVANGDFSRFKITSTDATVLLDASFPSGGSLLYGSNARMPVMGILVDCNSHTVGQFIRVENGSDLHILEGCGAMNGAGADAQGIIVRNNSRVIGTGVKFTGFTNHGAWITHRSDGYLTESDFSGNGTDNVFLSRASFLFAAGSNFNNAGEIGLLARRSYAVVVPVFDATSTFDGCGNWGIFAEQGSTVVASQRGGVQPTNIGSFQGVRAASLSNVYIEGMIITNPTFDAIKAEGCSRIQANSVELSGVGRDAFVAREGSEVYAESATATSVTGSVVVGDKSSRVMLPSITATGAGSATAAIVLVGAYADISGGDVSGAASDGAQLTAGAELRAVGATMSGAGGAALNCDGSRANVSDSDLSGATTFGIRAVQGSYVIAHTTNAQKGGSTSTSDVAIGSGSIVAFGSGTGGVSTTVNSINGSGIVFQ